MMLLNFKNYKESSAVPKNSGTLACLQFFKNNLILLIGIILIIILVIMHFCIPAIQQNVQVQPEFQSSRDDYIMSNTYRDEVINGISLKNNRLIAADITEENGLKTLSVKVVHTSNATGIANKRNTHFYDACDLVTNQGINPYEKYTRIVYKVVARDTETELMYFVLDENIMLDILDKYINYKNLYEYCLDLQLSDGFK